MLLLKSSLGLHKTYPNRNIKWNEILLQAVQELHQMFSQSRVTTSKHHSPRAIDCLETVTIKDASFENVKMQDKIGTDSPFFFLRPEIFAQEPAGTDTRKPCSG
jgi:hypothetical protein